MNSTMHQIDTPIKTGITCITSILPCILMEQILSLDEMMRSLNLMELLYELISQQSELARKKSHLSGTKSKKAVQT